jgi:hypothetical protein
MLGSGLPNTLSRAAMVLLLGANGCSVSPDTPAPSERTRLPDIVALAPPEAAASSPVEALPYGGVGGIPGEWTWVDFPDSHCANGSPTGIAVNVNPGASHLVLFLEAGGACATGQDCWVQPTAVNIASGYGVEQLGGDAALDQFIFRRDDASNPFSDASYVFVPYCTGDLHAGNGIATYEVNGEPTTTYHYGAHNLDLYLEKLGRSFPSVDHVWLVGQSAGGFGTLFNQSYVANAFGVRTDVIDDSGPGIGVSGFPASWQVRLPLSCSYCQDGLDPLFLFDRMTYPNARFGFLSFQEDVVLPGFYGATQQNVDQWLGVFEQSFSELLNTQSFIAPGTGHVVMSSELDAGTQASLAVWLEEMVTDDPDWSVAPRPSTPPGTVGSVLPEVLRLDR